MRLGITVPPPEFFGETGDTVLDRISGEIGFHEVSYWVACPPLSYIRSAPTDDRWVVSKGGMFLKTVDQDFASTRCKPLHASERRGRCPFSGVNEAAVARGLSVRAIISAAETGLMSAKYTFAACRNVWGHVSDHAVCLCNQDVQAFLVVLAKSIRATFPEDGITVRNLTIAAARPEFENIAIFRPVEVLQKHLMALCFCESCFQQAEKAGVDAAAVQRKTKVLLGQTFERDQYDITEWRAQVLEDRDIAFYHRFRADELGGLCHRLIEECHGNVRFDFGGSLQPKLEFPVEVVDSKYIVEPVTGIEPPTMLPSSNVSCAKSLRMPAQVMAGAREGQLTAYVADCVGKGIESIEIDHFALLPEHTLAEIGRAIRFARRSG